MSAKKTPKASQPPSGPDRSAAAGDVPAGELGRPGVLTGAAVVAALEGAVLAAWGGYMLVEGLLGNPDQPMQAEIGGLCVLALAAMPLVAARGLWHARRWSRGPVLIIQILALPVAWTMVQSGGAMIAAGIALGLVALAGLYLLMNPATTQALERSREPS